MKNRQTPHIDHILLLEQTLQDIVERYKGNSSISSEGMWSDEYFESHEIAEQASRLRAMILSMGTRAPACFTNRVISLALEIDPPFPGYVTALH